MDRDGLFAKIEKLRTQMERERQDDLTSRELLLLSKQMDRLINAYMREGRIGDRLQMGNGSKMICAGPSDRLQ